MKLIWTSRIGQHISVDLRHVPKLPNPALTATRTTASTNTNTGEIKFLVNSILHKCDVTAARDAGVDGISASSPK